MKCGDPDLPLGPMKDWDDYQATARLLVNIRKAQGRDNTYIPKMQRTRQRNSLHPKVQEKLEWLSEEHFSKQSSSPSSSSSSSWRQNWWQDAQWQDSQWEDHPWHEQQWEAHWVRFCYSLFRGQTLANAVHATGGEDSIPCRTHIFLSVVRSCQSPPHCCTGRTFVCGSRVSHGSRRVLLRALVNKIPSSHHVVAEQFLVSLPPVTLLIFPGQR